MSKNELSNSRSSNSLKGKGPSRSKSRSKRRPPRPEKYKKQQNPKFGTSRDGPGPRTRGDSDADAFASGQFRQFLAEQAAAARHKESRSEQNLKTKMAAAKVKSILEHHMAMMRLTKQMNKLLGDLRLVKEDINDKDSHMHGYDHERRHVSGNTFGYGAEETDSDSPPPPPSSTASTSKATKTGGKTGTRKKVASATKVNKKLKEGNEYVIFSGGPKGLEYTSLTKSQTGTFRMEIDVSNYDPEDLQINTEDRKTMHVKASRLGIRRTLKLVSPIGVDIDDVIIHYPKRGVLLLEAP